MKYSAIISVVGVRRNPLPVFDIEADDAGMAAFLAVDWPRETWPTVEPDRYRDNLWYVSDGMLTCKVSILGVRP